MINSLPPAAIFFLGALLVMLAPVRMRSSITLLVPIIGGLNLWNSLDSTGFEIAIFNVELNFLRVDTGFTTYC